MVAIAKKTLSAEEYLAFERASSEKHELINGELRPLHQDIQLMAGAGLRHVRIVRNVIRHLDTQLDDVPCEVLSSDMRTKLGQGDSYAYPDVIGVCGEPELEDAELDTLLNPVLIIEVLSPSTEAYDRGEKFHYYRSIVSLQEYVLIAQDRALVERFLRLPNGEWSLAAVSGVEAVLSLTSIPCTLDLAAVYKQVDFESDPNSK